VDYHLILLGQASIKIADESISGMGQFTGLVWFEGIRHGPGTLENAPLYKRGYWAKDKFYRGKVRLREGGP